MATFTSLPSAFFFSKAALSGEASRPTLRSLYSLRDRDGLAVEIEPRQDVHRRRHVVLRHLAGRRSGRASASGCARRQCRWLAPPSTRLSRVAPQDACLATSTSGMPCLAKKPFSLAIDQRRGVGQRDVAEHRPCRLPGPRPARRRRPEADAAARQRAAAPPRSRSQRRRNAGFSAGLRGSTWSCWLRSKRKRR